MITSQRFQTSRMVLRKCPFEQDIERYAQKVGWARVSEAGGSGQVKSRREVTWKAGPATRLHYVEDDMSPNCFVYVGSGTANMASSKGQEVYEKFYPWSLQDLVDQVEVASHPLELGQAVLRLGIAAPYQFDPGVFERVQIGLRNSDERVRDMSLWATTYSPWPEYRPLLAEIADYDRVEKLRERARLTLEAFDAGQVGHS